MADMVPVIRCKKTTFRGAGSVPVFVSLLRMRVIFSEASQKVSLTYFLPELYHTLILKVTLGKGNRITMIGLG